MSSPALPDADRNWVDDHAPAPLKPWLKLGRFDRPIGVWLLLLPGWWGIAWALARADRPIQLYDAWLFAAFAVGAAVMRAGGCAFNDIIDRRMDARVARTAARPVASGRIPVKAAWGFVIACGLIGLTILLGLNVTAVILGVASLGLVAAYPFMKRITWWPQAWLGLTFNWGIPMGFAAATPLWLASILEPPYLPRFQSPLWSQLTGTVPWQSFDAADLGWQLAGAGSIILLYLGAVLWTLGYDTVYALQDIEDDAFAGVKSSARRLGTATARGVAVAYGLCVMLMAAAGWMGAMGWAFFVGLAAFAAHLTMQVRRLRLDDPRRALTLFRSNRKAGWIVLIAIVAGGLTA